MVQINIFTENLYNAWKVNEKYVIEKTTLLLEYYIKHIGLKSCLAKEKFSSVTLDIVFTDSIAILAKENNAE